MPVRFAICWNFNPRSPHGERRGCREHENHRRDFNPRSPHGERHKNVVLLYQCNRFQSTLPARGATVTATRRNHFRQYFNPRSPHGERPETLMSCPSATWNFNPRSPHGERHVLRLDVLRLNGEFQSTLPARGATKLMGAPDDVVRISIHAPRTGSDMLAFFQILVSGNFNPRSPHGERL